MPATQQGHETESALADIPHQTRQRPNCPLVVLVQQHDGSVRNGPSSTAATTSSGSLNQLSVLSTVHRTMRCPARRRASSSRKPTAPYGGRNTRGRESPRICSSTSWPRWTLTMKSSWEISLRRKWRYPWLATSWPLVVRSAHQLGHLLGLETGEEKRRLDLVAPQDFEDPRRVLTMRPVVEGQAYAGIAASR